MASKSKSNFLLLLSAITLIIIVGGLFFGKYFSNPSIPSSPSNSYVSPTPTPISTVNWKTYKNIINNFKFEYPNDWIFENNPEYPLSLVSFFSKGSKPDHSFGDHTGNEILMVQFVKTTMSPEETRSKFYPDAILLKINDKDAFKNSRTVVIFSGSPANIEVAFFRFDKINTQFDQILSTFQFLD